MPASIRCLLIDLPQALAKSHAVDLDATQSVTIAEFRQAPHLPDNVSLIVTPLFRPEFDALEVIDLIGTCGYRGKLRILARALPNRALVLRELRAHATRRGIEVDLIDEA